jgi:transcriptional regulator with GAF, ATPase, and Fis domain
LENVIERALILSNASTLQIDAEVLGAIPWTPEPRDKRPQTVTERDRKVGSDLDSVQRDHIIATLRDTNWVIEGDRGAARRLGLKPGTLRHRMKKLGITRGAGQAE